VLDDYKMADDVKWGHLDILHVKGGDRKEIAQKPSYANYSSSVNGNSGLAHRSREPRGEPNENLRVTCRKDSAHCVVFQIWRSNIYEEKQA
jgi:hypothetical protein